MKCYPVLLITFLLYTNFCFSQWVQTNGPYGNTYISEIIPCDSLLFVATECGYFSKKEIPGNWKLNSIDNVNSYTKIGDSLVVGILSVGIKLIDLSNVEKPPVDLNYVTAKALSHSDSCLYGGNENQGFFKSTDNGRTCTFLNDGLPADTFWYPSGGQYYQHYVSSIEVSGNYIYCGTKKGIYRSTGSLNGWVGINSGIPSDTVTVIKEIDDTLYAAIGDNLYRTYDNGSNWGLFYHGPSKITSIFKVNNLFYAGTHDDGIFYSGNFGIHWNVINNGLTDLYITTISYYNSTLLCGTHSKGVFYFNDDLWINNRPGMICSSIRSVTCTDNFVFANDFNDVYISNPDDNWSVISPKVIYDFVGSVNSMNDTIFLSLQHYATSSSFEQPFIVYSSDNGSTWKYLYNPVPFARDDPYRIYCANNKLYAYEDEIMYYTGNLGVHWTNISLPSAYCNYFNDFIVNNSTPFAAACGNGEVVKLDSDQNWGLSNNGLPTDREPQSLAYCSNALFAYFEVHGMYVSFTDGNSWMPANNGLLADFGIGDFVNYGTILFVITEYGVFYTLDYGRNWFACNNGLKNVKVSSIKILKDTLYVGTYGNGIWRQAIKKMNLAVPGFMRSPEQLRIIPNPANDRVTLVVNQEIVLQNAKLIIYNIQGQLLLQQTVIGEKTELDISSLPKGMYVVKFINNERTGVSRFMKE
jgi:hypothetical protein